MMINKKTVKEIEFKENFSDEKNNSFELKTSNIDTFHVQMHAYSKENLSNTFFKELRQFIDAVEEQWSLEEPDES